MFINILRHTSCLWNTIISTKGDFPEKFAKSHENVQIVCLCPNK